MPTGLRLALRSTRVKFLLLWTFIAICLSFSFYVTWQGSYFDKATSLKGLLHSDRLLDDLSKAAQNETLGFEKIFYISMPQ